MLSRSRPTLPATLGSGVRQKCFGCSKETPEDQWFCRVPRGPERIVLCSPSCAIRRFDASHRNGDGARDDFQDYERRLQFGLTQTPESNIR